MWAMGLDKDRRRDFPKVNVPETVIHEEHLTGLNMDPEENRDKPEGKGGRG